jgi:DNA-binding CsgD family transcriptional regulator
VVAEYDEPLTDRELEITELVADGLTNREVAEKLYISPNTVKVHLRNIFTKAGVSSRTELSMLAIQRGWITVPTQEGNEEEEEISPGEGQAYEAESEQLEAAIESWPWTRWAALAFGITITLFIIILPERTRVQSSSRDPGEVFEQTNTTANVLVSGEEAGWRELPPSPIRRAGAAAVLWNGEIAVIGGITDQGPTDRVDVYAAAEEEWTEWTPRPIALANVGVSSLAEGLLVPGGCDGNLEPQAVTHLLDPETGTWREVAPLPVPLCAYAIATYNEQAYVFGGWDGTSYRARSYVYDPQIDAWSELAPAQEARGFGSAAGLEERLFYVGGFDGSQELSTCEMYIPDDDRWQTCASMIQPRGGLSLTNLGGQLYAIGGGWQTVLGFNERYNPRTNEWTVLETPIVGEWRNMSVVSIETEIYAVCGWSGQDFLNRTYALEALPWRVFIPGAFRSP